MGDDVFKLVGLINDQTSGIRIGTPAVTSRGMKAAQAKEIASFIATVLKHPEDKKIIEDVRVKVTEVCDAFPVYKIRNE